MRTVLRRPLAAALLAAGVVLAAPGCVTTTEAPAKAAAAPEAAAPREASAPKEPSGPKAERSGHGIKLTSGDPTDVAVQDGGPGVGDYALVLPKNVVYLPWKVVGGGIKGASDGVRAGFDKGRMPMLGLLFSPVNLVTGFVTGFFEGAVMSPGVVGPSDHFGRAMSGPTKRATTIWWYP